MVYRSTVKGKNVIVVEDNISSGITVSAFARALTEYGGNVKAMIGMTFGQDGDIASKNSKNNTLIEMKAGELYDKTLRGDDGRGKAGNAETERNDKGSRQDNGKKDEGGRRKGNKVKNSLKESGSAYLEEEHIAESIEKIEEGLGITGGEMPTEKEVHKMAQKIIERYET